MTGRIGFFLLVQTASGTLRRCTAPVVSIIDRLGADGTGEHMADQPAVGRFKPHPPSRFYVLTIPFVPWRDGTLSTFGEGKEVMLFLKNQN